MDNIVHYYFIINSTYKKSKRSTFWILIFVLPFQFVFTKTVLKRIIKNKLAYSLIIFLKVVFPLASILIKYVPLDRLDKSIVVVSEFIFKDMIF